MHFLNNLFKTSHLKKYDSTFGIPEVAKMKQYVKKGDASQILDLFSTTQLPGLKIMFIQEICEPNGRAKWLDELIEKHPDNYYSYLISGAHAIRWAWEARSAKLAVELSESQVDLFFERLGFAKEILLKSSRINSADPMPWAELLTVARGLEEPLDYLEEIFSEAIRRDRNYYNSYPNKLQAICEKWGGSHEMMFDFAKGVSNGMQDGCCQHALIPLAHYERHLYFYISDENLSLADSYYQQEDVAQEILLAANKSIFSPKWKSSTMNTEIENIFAAIFWLSGDASNCKKALLLAGRKPSKGIWALLGTDWMTYAHKAARYSRI